MEEVLKEKLREKIKNLIDQFTDELAKLEEDTKPIAPENSLGRISRMDAINNKSVVEAAVRTKRQKLNSLKIAMTKIDMADFGTCTLCGQNIQEGRLLFMPESHRCIRCADR